MKRTRTKNSDLIESIKNHANNKTIHEYVSTGSFWLDLTLGGGFVFGNVVNVVGDSGTAKTLLLLETCFQGNKQYKDSLIIRYNDIERGSAGFPSQQMYGMSIPPEYNPPPSSTIEKVDQDLFHHMDNLKEDQKLLYVWDSYDSTTSEAEEERSEKRRKAIEKGKEYDVGSYATEKVRMLGQIFKSFENHPNIKNTLLIIISQVRYIMNSGYGPKFNRTGGKALDHFTSQILWLYQIGKIKKKYKSGKELVQGVSIKTKTTKNRYQMPFMISCFDIHYNYGIDWIASCVDYLFDLRTDNGKVSKKINIEFNNETFKSRRKLIKFIEDNDLEEVLKMKVQLKWDQEMKDLIPSRKSKIGEKENGQFR